VTAVPSLSRMRVWVWLRDWRWGASRRVFLLATGCALVHSLLFVLAMPLLSWWGFALVAMLPAMLAAWIGAVAPKDIRLRWVLLGVTVGCLPRELVQHHWTWAVTALGTVPLILLQAAWTGLFALLGSWVLRIGRERATMSGFARLMWIMPLLWVGVEYFRARVFLGGYAWGLVVHPLIDWPGAAAWASVGGVWMVSLLVAIMSASGLVVVIGVWHRRLDRTLALGACLCIFSFALLAFGQRLVPAIRMQGSVPVAIVQTNVPQSNKVEWTLDQQVVDFRRFVALTQAAVVPLEGSTSANSDLAKPVLPAFVVWPETMMPGVSIQPEVGAELDAKKITLGSEQELPGLNGAKRVPATVFATALLSVSRALDVPMIVGDESLTQFRATVDDKNGVAFDHDKRFNSVFLIVNGEVAAQRYDKIELTPFGESIPVLWRWPGVVQALADFAASGMALDLTPGSQRKVMSIPLAKEHASAERVSGMLRAVTPICFEVTVPELCRSMVYERGARRADVFINLTNDGWFTTSNASRVQHLQVSRWRCLENGTPMVRSANTGISAIIDARGRVTMMGIEAVGGVGGAGELWQSDGIIRGRVELPAPFSLTIYARVGDMFGLGACGGSGMLLCWTLLSGFWTRKSNRRASKA